MVVISRREKGAFIVHSASDKILSAKCSNVQCTLYHRLITSCGHLPLACLCVSSAVCEVVCVGVGGGCRAVVLARRCDDDLFGSV